MSLHSQRWKAAQEQEAEFWKKDYFRDSEFKESLVKYSEVFSRIEDRYRFDDQTKILDLGCGATCVSVFFKKGVKYGVDPLVDIFLKKDREKLSGKIDIFGGTGEAIPFEDGFFDVVLCRNSLDHMDDIQAVMEEIRRVSKPGAVILLSLYTYTKFITSLKKFSEYIPTLRNVEHPHTFTPSQFMDFCRQHFDIQEEIIIFEGKSSVDYGKQDVELIEPLFYKMVAGLNKYLFKNKWFVREYLLICRRRK